MKKIMKKVALFVCAIAMLTGCQQLQQFSQNENVKQVVATILTNVLQGQGTPRNFAGTISTQLLQKNSYGEYVFVNGTGKKAPSTATISTTMTQNSVNMVIPALTIDGANMSQVKLVNLALSNGTIAVGDNTSADATITVGGKTYTISAVYFDKCVYSESGEFNGGVMQIYFGDNSELVADMTFTGKLVK